MEDKIINKVAKSGIININLETFYPKGTRVLFDIKELLYEGLILKEKDFREFIKNEDWILNNLVHHINENKLDYRIENLEWTTNKKNSHKGNMGSKIDVNDVYRKVSELKWFKK